MLPTDKYTTKTYKISTKVHISLAWGPNSDNFEIKDTITFGLLFKCSCD